MRRYIFLNIPTALLRTVVVFLLAAAFSAATPALTPPKPGTAVQTSRKTASKKAAGKTASGGKKSGQELKAVPPEGEFGESAEIREHAEWRWHLLTYPKKTIPNQPWTRARKWVAKHVMPGVPWPGARKGLVRTADGMTSAMTTVPSENWVSLGPAPIDTTTQAGGYIYGKVTGRFNAVAVDPTTVGNPGHITAYAGGASGGMWKTTNGFGPNTVWTSLWDDNTAVTQAVSAIALDPNNPHIIYAGTGDFDASDQFSAGIMKSTDAGATWTQLGADVFTPFAPGTPIWGNQNVGSIVVDPHNSSNVVVGTRFDLFISHDAGQTWTRCPFGANPTNPKTGPINAINRISSILIDSSTNPTTVYIAVGYVDSGYNGDNGIYKGTIPNSGPLVPTLITTGSNGWPSGTGNGTNGATDVGRIEMASSRGNVGHTLTIYAQVEDASQHNALGTWVTTNGGVTWTQLSGSADSNYKDCNGSRTGEGQDWYDLFLLADPGNDKVIYIGRTSLYKGTVNSSYSSMTIDDLGAVYSTACTGYGTLHPDQHGAAWISGTGASTQFLLGNDGGVYLADGTEGGFTELNDTINATQWYAGQVGKNFAGGTQYLFAGAQDNGNATWDSSDTDRTWQARSGGGDGFFTAFDPISGTLTSGKWLTEYVNGSMSMSNSGASGYFITVNGGWNNDRNAWSAPFLIDAFHGNTTTCNDLVYGSQYVYANDRGGNSVTAQRKNWKKISPDLTKGSGSIISLNFAMSDPKGVIAGTDDGNIQWTDNAFYGTNCTQAAANTANFSCTHQGSATWTNLTQSNGVLPNRAILGVCFAPTTIYKVFAAVGGFDENTPSTPGHVFECINNAGTWTWYDKTGNLPDVPAESIVINPNNANQAFLGTDFGFYYTDNINASTPVWYRYQYGLPNTIIEHLVVDRGPDSSPYASTTLVAFTYGRGAYAIRLPGSTGFPPHPVPDTMKGVKDGSSVDITYDASCQNAGTNVYWGHLGDFQSVTGGLCGAGNSGTISAAPIPAGSWWIITGTDEGGSTISSFGKNSTGNERALTGWNSVTGCTASQQNTTATCP